MATITTNKTPIEILKEMKQDGTCIEFITINGQKIGMLGSVNDADREKALKTLNDAYLASNGDIYDMMTKLAICATMTEKEIEPDEVVKVHGTEVVLDYAKRKAYTMDGYEVANCDDMPTMPSEAVKALLIARAEANV